MRMNSVIDLDQVPVPLQTSIIDSSNARNDGEEVGYCGQIYQFDRVFVGPFPVADKHLTIAVDSIAGSMTPASRVIKVDGRS